MIQLICHWIRQSGNLIAYTMAAVSYDAMGSGSVMRLLPVLSRISPRLVQERV